MAFIRERHECLTGCQDRSPWSAKTDLQYDFIMVYGVDDEDLFDLGEEIDGADEPEPVEQDDGVGEAQAPLGEAVTVALDPSELSESLGDETPAPDESQPVDQAALTRRLLFEDEGDAVEGLPKEGGQDA